MLYLNVEISCLIIFTNDTNMTYITFYVLILSSIWVLIISLLLIFRINNKAPPQSGQKDLMILQTNLYM